MLNHALAYLVALAVGTLSGDALLHLLPQATGAHSHNHDHSHAHGAEEDHFDFLWKGLVACTGIYVFYILETTMGFIRRRRERKRQFHHQNGQVHDCDAELTKVVSMSGSSSTFLNGSGSPLLKTDQKCYQPDNGVTSLVQQDDFCVLKEHDGKPDNHRMDLKMDNGLVATGHTHHHHSGEVPKTIANLAWMVIIGDGLHNMTDGLAIGAAFSSSIGAGLGTVLAIFFHEIPQELADFAVLLNAGMTVKQALFWNFLSACTCFLGLIIGLLVGEYTHGMILWILAFTAGGFLYIALVDMLPALINQLTNEGWKLRFFIQNAGLLSGFWVMVLIALKEESLSDYFK